MQEASRSKKGFRNIAFSFAASVLSLLLSFVSRAYFIRLLGDEYLGLNGLFSNVLSFLSLAEMGVGVAINFALYEPVKDQNEERIKSLMRLYRVFYTRIGLIVFVAGLILTPLLPYLIRDIPDIPHIYLYFILYVTNSAVSYLFTYKRSLIICDQREYISTITTFAAKVIVTILQIIVLSLYHSYLWYLIVLIICTLAENVVISRIVDKEYPYIKEKEYIELSKNERKGILRNVYSLICHKIGTVIVFSSDNIIISRFIGLSAVGFYSNYSLLIHSINTIVNKVFDTLTASVGNLMVSSKNEHSKDVLYRMLFANMILYGITSVFLLNLIEPFIEMWIGAKYIMSKEVLFLAIISYYLTGMRKSLLVFKDASGIFRQDQYKPLVEGLANIVYSIPLALKMGVSGVILGTILSTVTVSFWYEAYVFFKVKYNEKMFHYLLIQLKYLMFNCVLWVLSVFISEYISLPGLLGFGAKGVICFVLFTISIIIMFGKSEEFSYFCHLLKGIRYRK